MQYLVYTHLPARLRNSFTLSNNTPRKARPLDLYLYNILPFYPKYAESFSTLRKP